MGQRSYIPCLCKSFSGGGEEASRGFCPSAALGLSVATIFKLFFFVICTSVHLQERSFIHSLIPLFIYSFVMASRGTQLSSNLLAAKL